MVDYNNLLQRLKHAIFGADGIYNEEVKDIKINIAQLEIIYLLNNENPYSQKELAKKLYSPLSTINTIIKKWEKKELIQLVPIEGKKREMNVYLTEKGLAIKKQVMDYLYKAEIDAMKKTLDKYSSEFIDALEYYSDSLKASLNSLK